MNYHRHSPCRAAASLLSVRDAIGRLPLRESSRELSRRSARRSILGRSLSAWGLGAVWGLLSFPLQVWSGEPEPMPVPVATSGASASGELELAGELCATPTLPEDPGSCEPLPVPDGVAVVAVAAATLLESSPGSIPGFLSADTEISHEALFAVLGGEARPADLPADVRQDVLRLVSASGLSDLSSLSDLSDISDLSEDLVLSQAPESGGVFGLSWPALALVGGGGLVAAAVVAGGSGDEAASSSEDAGGTNAVPAVVTAGSMVAPGELMAEEGAPEGWDVSDWFTDADAGDVLTFTGSLQKTSAAMGTSLEAVNWLVLDARTGSLTIAAGATDDAEVGLYTLTIVASDGTASTTHKASLTIVDDPTDNGNSGNSDGRPTVVTTGARAAPRALEADEGASASWDVSNWFFDADDTLTFTATLQKTSDATAMALAAGDWLVLNSATGL